MYYFCIYNAIRKVTDIYWIADNKENSFFFFFLVVHLYKKHLVALLLVFVLIFIEIDDGN